MVPLLLLLLLAAAPPASAAGESFIAISKSGLMHLDASGTLLAWRPETFQWWQGWNVAANPRNGTVCWVSAPEDHDIEGVMRCAPVSNLNETWDLPRPKLLRVNQADALAFDWVSENWYITVSRENFVCSYMFDRCAKLGRSGGNVRYYAAYDIPNRLLFRIATTEFGPYRLESVRLDGSDVRVLPTSLSYPSGLAVDPVRRHVYIFDQITSFKDGLYRVDYDGRNKQRVTDYEESTFLSYRRGVAVVDGLAVVMWQDQKVVSSISPDEKVTDLVKGAVKGETIPALAEVKDLLAVTVVSPKTQPDVEDRCVGANCSDICIPVVTNSSAEATCLCPAGEELVDLGCYKTHPTYLLVSGSGSLQSVDLQTNQVTQLLAQDVTHLDFFWEGGNQYTLFWVAAGGLYSAHWSPVATNLNVKQIVNASDTVKVLDLAVDWNQRHIFWLEDDPTQSRFDDPISLRMAPLDGAYVRTIIRDTRHGPSCLVVKPPGRSLFYVEERWGTLEFNDPNVGDAKSSYTMYFSKKFISSPPEDIVVDPFLGEERWPDRFLWLNRANQSVDYLQHPYIFKSHQLYRLFTHPRLAEAGGLDVLQSRLFWTDRRSGQLWTVDTETGEEPHALNITAGTGPVRVLHPWRQPPSSRQLCDENHNGCSHFCLRGVADFKEVATCACPDNMELSSDRKTCQ